MDRSAGTRGVLRCLAAAALFGASAPAASVLVGDVGTLTLAGLLYVGAALAVVPAAVASPPDRAAVRASRRPVAVAVVVGGALGPALLVAGLARTSAASASLLLNAELVATVALAATVFREHIGGRLASAAGLVTAAGVALVWAPGAGFDVGALLIVAACVCWGIDNGVTAGIDRLAPEHVTLAKGAVAGTANLVLGLLVGGASGLDARTVGSALVVGALGYGMSITLWVKGAHDLGAARAQVLFATGPFLGAVVAWTVLGEMVTGLQLVAVVLAAAGVSLSLRTGHGHDHRHEPVVHDHEHTHDDDHHEHPHAGSERRHAHRHSHRELVHTHSHVPDLHHRHPH